ncbi:RNA-directed DNA polymerase, eukaryota, reverse transcriptase zinc-binding domain protein [Tanacetum coccineum]
MCAVIETQVSKKFVNQVGDNIFGYWNWVSNLVDSNRGCRIMVGWDRNIVGANLISQTDQVMHFEVNFIHDHRKQFMSFVYAKNFERDRKPLWRNLSEHNMLVSNEPWVVLGDFNVIMNTDECSNSFNIVDRDMDVFRRVLHSLELEDIVSYGMFYTWIQKRRNPEAGMLKKLDRVLGNASFLSSYASCFAKFLPYMTSDHCPAIIVYPDVKGFKPRSFRFMNFLTDKPEFLSTVKDNWYSEVHGFYMFVLAKRLKNMKKHLRNMNRLNGNVFDKVKVLREELKRVQNCLDKDPDCVHLREEEYVFCNAYKEAARDEEMILRQKTKIQWLKDGDQNSAYFHNSLKGRMFRSRIEVVYDSEGHKYEGDYIAPKFVDHFSKFLGTEDEVFPIEDPDSLFINKLDAQCADYMVRPVLDDEIKFAMFSIEDDKAAGPDGYTSKFFKTAWNIVGGDVCAAVKEFFYSSNDISKVITNGFREVLGSIVDSNLSAFIREGKISDKFPFGSKEFMHGVASVLSSLHVYWASMFMLPVSICDSIDKLFKNFIWGKSESSSGIASVSWKDVCRPKNQGGLGLKSLRVMNCALMVKQQWWDSFSWNLKQILKLRDSVRKFIGYKIGNGIDCFVWYDRWHSNGPLCRLISNHIISSCGFDLNAKVADLICGNNWIWPIEWSELFSEVIDVPVPVLSSDSVDKALWFNKKNEEVQFSVKEAWKVLRIDGPEVIVAHKILFRSVERPADKVFDIIVDTVRLRLLGLKIKRSHEVDKAAAIWKIPIKYFCGAFLGLDIMDFSIGRGRSGGIRGLGCAQTRDDLVDLTGVMLVSSLISLRLVVCCFGLELFSWYSLMGVWENTSWVRFWAAYIFGVIRLFNFGSISSYADFGLYLDAGSRLEWLKDFSSDLVRILGSLNVQVLNFKGSGYHQKDRKPSKSDKLSIEELKNTVVAKSRPKSKNVKVRVNTEESAVKPEPELKNTIGCKS